MQRKVCPRDVDIEVGFQFFNTPGTEITPRSDVVGEDFQIDNRTHPLALRVKWGHVQFPKKLDLAPRIP